MDRGHGGFPVALRRDPTSSGVDIYMVQFTHVFAARRLSWLLFLFLFSRCALFLTRLFTTPAVWMN